MSRSLLDVMGRPLVALMVLGWLAQPSAAQHERLLVVRYDDYAPFSHYAGLHAPDLERRLLELFAAHGAKLVVGVIPFPLAAPGTPDMSPEGAARPSWLANAHDPWVGLLREGVARGVFEPALHGFEHRQRALPGQRPGEFCGQPTTWQHDVIRRGRDALAAVLRSPVLVFVPPWNAWDAATVAALDDLGFEWCSADLYHAEMPFSRIRHVPQCNSDPTEVLGLVRGGAEPPGSIVVLVTHPFDFIGPNGEAYFIALEELLALVDSSHDWRCVGMVDLPRASDEEWDQRFRRAVAWQGAQQATGDTWGPARWIKASPIVYAPSAWYPSHTWPWKLALITTWLGSAGIAAFGAWALARRLLRSRARALLASMSVVTGLLVLVHGAWVINRHGYHVRGLRWQAICVTAAVTVALMVNALRTRSAVPNLGATARQQPP